MTPLLDLSTLDWTLTGWRPFAWKLRKSAETGGFLSPDHGPFPARLPGSVQENLRRAGAIPDWHIGRYSLAIEWVEHRHWMFSATLPQLDLSGAKEAVFCADVLDYSKVVDGIVRLVQNEHVNLSETLAERIAAECLADARVETVRVRIEKPEVMQSCRSVGIEIERSRCAAP